MPPPPAPPDSVAALFSCSEREVSWEDAGLAGGHGVFFHYVIEGLKGQADVDGDHKVSLLELTEYTQKTVSAFVRRKHAVSQLPRLRGDIGPVALIDVAARPAQARTITNSIGMTLNLIEPGKFLMGSAPGDKEAFDGEKPWHWVGITKPFYLGVTEVTRGQFRRFVDDAGYQTEAEKDGKGGWGWNDGAKNFEQNPRFNWQNAGFDQTDEHPVVNVSWNDAQAFIAWLNRKEGQGNVYRLPTEAEWEYACRAGTNTKYACGDDPEGLAAIGNIADATAKEKYTDRTTIAARDGYAYTAPVGRFQPNGFGLFDMHGNVWEWCADWYDKDYYKQSPLEDPQGPEKASNRVFRGGCWFSGPRGARSADRAGILPGFRVSYLGFRLTRVQSVR
jgi:formylglycine-generating enzyme required for sulfatase activity